MAAPTTQLITDFAGADENPLSEGGIWQAGALTAGGNDMQKVSGQAKSIGTGTGLNSRKVASKIYSRNQEAWCTVPALPAAASVVGLWCRISGEPTSSTVVGYVGEYLVGTGWRIFSCVPPFNFTSIAGVDATVMAAGDGMWLSCQDDVISFYHFTGGVWVLRNQATNSDVPGGGKIGIEIFDDSCAIDDFGGGSPMGDLQVPSVYPVQRFGPF
jgi:hypothetical protein